MSSLQGEHYVFQAATSVAVTSTGDKLLFAPTMPVDIIRIGGLVTVAHTGADMVVVADKRIVVGSDTDRVAAGAMAARTIGDLVAGEVWVAEPADGVAHAQVDPGEEVVIEVTTAAGAGTDWLFVHYRPRPFQTGRIASVTVYNS